VRAISFIFGGLSTSSCGYEPALKVVAYCLERIHVTLNCLLRNRDRGILMIDKVQRQKRKPRSRAAGFGFLDKRIRMEAFRKKKSPGSPANKGAKIIGCLTDTNAQ